MNKKEIFADRIGQIHFAGGMVRFDFETLQPEEEANFLLRKAMCVLLCLHRASWQRLIQCNN